VYNVKGEQSATVTVRLAKENGRYRVSAQEPRLGLPELLKAVKPELRAGQGCSLILANLDHAMALNDKYGYLFGDLVLSRVHRVFELEEQSGAGEFYRLGGDDFAVLIPGSNTAQVDALAERIRSRVYELEIPLHAAGKGGEMADRVTLSLGVVHVPPEASRSPKEVWQIAQYTIWKAKDAGRNAVKIAVAI
jgi:diguanylate cyclase (GGDEF)-like protein